MKLLPFRAKWAKKIEFIFTCVGFAVGLGNVWRFPYLAFKNGGGAFLISYWCMQILVGMPLFFMELSFGQFASQGPLTIWKVNPILKGIGISMAVVCGLIVLYYNVLVSYIVFYFCSSMQTPLPWSHCDHYWSSPNCRVDDTGFNVTNPTSDSGSNITMNGTEVSSTISPTEDYF